MQCTGIAVLLLFVVTLRAAETFHYKVCSGSTGYGMWESNYQNLKDQYTNCTYVDGNLEILWLEDNETDLSFLKDIREVTGYVLISNVNIPRVVLPNLAIIRGRTLKNIGDETGFALIVQSNRLERLALPALREISAGIVRVFANENLCFVYSIKWEDIVNDFVLPHLTYVGSTSPESCPACHENCTDGCWGPGPLSCQTFSKINCSPKCYGGRCFGPNDQECCHSVCAAGCKGPTQRDCFACKNVNDSGVCKEECPHVWRYNPAIKSLERHSKGKYAYGSICVKDCPEPFLRDSGACVEFCPDTKKAVDGECVPCGDGPCPRVCQEGELGFVRSENLYKFVGCTVIVGNLIIYDESLEGHTDPDDDFSTHPNALEVFSTLREVTGYVAMDSILPSIKNLSSFRNLEIIHGKKLLLGGAALYIEKTSLESLNLRSLREIRRGHVIIRNNPKLCFVSEINWKQIMGSNTADLEVGNNAAEDYCRERGLVCHEECSKDGCWGKGPEEWLSCENYRFNDTCIPHCNAILGYYAANRTCEKCDLECLGGCLGPGPSNCTSCLNVRDGPHCVSQCPVNKYDENGECMPCYENCIKG